MTIGVGTSTIEAELARFSSGRDSVAPIGQAERNARIARAQGLMREKGMQALYLDASTSNFYFTGLRYGRSERMHGAILPAQGKLIHISPAFELEKLRAMMGRDEPVRCWEEHESPTELVVSTLRELGISGGAIGIDPMTPFFTFDGLRHAGRHLDWIDGGAITAGCRAIKSAQEIALIQTAMDLTMQAQAATARILREGMTTDEVKAFLTEAHARLGFDGPPAFNIVLFGEPTAYPHGVPYPQTLKAGDMVLVDVGASLHGYYSDITRSYVFGEPTERQRFIWNTAKAATLAAFDAARIGAASGSVDAAARGVIENAGLGPGYKTPGLPHRTGHGLGLDVHEEPYIVQGNSTPLQKGMCFSNEPMICVYGEFGVRLEDHIYMADDGPRWFTQPARSIDDPFAA